VKKISLYIQVITFEEVTRNSTDKNNFQLSYPVNSGTDSQLHTVGCVVM